MRGKMDELTLQWIQISKFLPLAVCAGLYGFGGMINKALRRYVAPAVLVGSLCLYAAIANKFSWWILLCYPLYLGAFSLGYGADKFWQKILKRAYCGAAISCASLPCALAVGSLNLWVFHFVVMTGTMIYLGAFNPTPSARNEETAIGAMACFMPLFFI